MRHKDRAKFVSLANKRVTRAIKAQSPRTPVVMMTGWGTLMKEEGEPAIQADALLAKPPRIQELNDLLLKIADGKK